MGHNLDGGKILALRGRPAGRESRDDSDSELGSRVNLHGVSSSWLSVTRLKPHHTTGDPVQ
jgi:hypothetical protein